MSAAFEEQALEDVVDKIMLFGQWPQPSRNRHVPMKFDLVEFVRSDKSGVDPVELAEFFVSGLIDYGYGFTDARMSWEKKITAALIEHLKGSEIVKERADELEAEAYEDHMDVSAA